MAEKLTDKQQRFCEEYMIDMNATQAYIRAGYSIKSEAAAAVEGFKLLRNPKIAAKIAELKQERSKRTEITADRVLKELASIGFSKITDYLKVGEEELEVPKENPFYDAGEDDEDGLPIVTEKKVFKLVEIFNTDKVPKESIPAIASIKQGRSGIELRLHDKNKALELIARHLGMLNDKLTLNVDDEMKTLYKMVMSNANNA